MCNTRVHSGTVRGFSSNVQKYHVGREIRNAISQAVLRHLTSVFNDFSNRPVFTHNACYLHFRQCPLEWLKLCQPVLLQI